MKKMIAIIIVLSIVTIVTICSGVYIGVTHKRSSKYLVFPKNIDVPSPIEKSDEGFVQLSEVNMHYVKYGTTGHPIILIHGNGGNADSLKGLAKYLANDYVVYCIADRCQGESSNPGVITYDLMAKDVYEFMQAKNLEKPYVLGHSDGGMVALTIASLYPDSIGACVSCGSNSNPKTFKFYFTWMVKISNAFSPNKLNDLMLTLPDFTPEFLSRIKVPTYIIAGEFDIMPLSDSVYIHEHIKSSKLSIVKWANHSSYIKTNPKKIYALAKPFFDELQTAS